jgi:hypothetical protein
MQSPAFISGDFDTHFIKKYYSPVSASADLDTIQVAALAAGYLQSEEDAKLVTVSNGQHGWKRRAITRD